MDEIIIINKSNEYHTHYFYSRVYMYIDNYIYVFL